MNTTFPTSRPLLSAFSLVEMLAVITIIGIVVFLAVPNLVQIKSDAEDSHAEARVQALNMAMAAYLNSKGPAAAAEWETAANDGGRYDLVKSHLAFSSADLATYLPGYTVTFPDNIMALEEVTSTKTVSTN